jgi:hypothetical protein
MESISSSAENASLLKVSSLAFHHPVNCLRSEGAVYDPVTKTTASDTNFQFAFDNFTDATQCALDASALQELGANSISVYYIDIEKDHSGCMAAFANVGIYVWVGLFTPQTEIYKVCVLSYTYAGAVPLR